MARVDFSEIRETITPPGVYLCEVMKNEERTSKRGDAMFNVKWVAISDRSCHVYDTVMLTGNGAGIGCKKLEALGWPRSFKGEVSAHELIGKRAWLFLVVETYNGQSKLKVDIAQGTHCGYQPEGSEPDQGWSKPTGADDQGLTPDETPF